MIFGASQYARLCLPRCPIYDLGKGTLLFLGRGPNSEAFSMQSWNILAARVGKAIRAL